MYSTTCTRLKWLKERYVQQTELAGFVAADTLPAVEASSLPERKRERERERVVYQLKRKDLLTCGNARLPARLCALLSLFAFTRKVPVSVVKVYQQLLDIWHAAAYIDSDNYCQTGMPQSRVSGMKKVGVDKWYVLMTRESPAISNFASHRIQLRPCQPCWE